MRRRSNTPKHVSEIGPYIVDRYLGEGASGRVMLAHHNKTGKKVAIKIIAKKQFVEHEDLKNKVQREIALMSLVDHPSIIKLMDVMENEENLFIMMEYAENGELFDYLVTRQYLTEGSAIEFIRQIIFGLEYLHAHGICHRDLKPENILLDSAMRIKIADFGFARWTTDEPLTGCRGSGSPHYAAPEVLEGGPYDGRTADVWSVGVILFCLLARYLPFNDQSPSRLIEKVKKGAFSMPEFSEKVKDLIRKMLTRDPTKRITIAEIKQHPCFLSGLPPDYILPSPIHVKCANNINESDIPMQLLADVQKFGYSDQEHFMKSITSDGNNVGKVLLSMFLRNVSLEQLPWSSKEHVYVTSEQLRDRSFMKPNEAPVRENTDQFYRHNVGVEADNVPDPGCGVISRPSWITDGITIDKVVESMSWKCSKRQWVVLADLQKKLTELGLEWMHPNEQCILFRMSAVSVYGSIRCVSVSEDSVSVSAILHKGNPADFDQLVENISVIFS